MGQSNSKLGRANKANKTNKPKEVNKGNTAKTMFSSSPPPPPYASQATSSSTSPETLPATSPVSQSSNVYGIKATDTPQWEWNNAQCRQWLTEVLVHYCLNDRKHAEDSARKAMHGGFGPNIYQFGPKTWYNSLGTVTGGAVFSLIFARAKGKGGLPSGITYSHFQIKFVEKH